MRNPRRTAVTASALVIGLSLVGLVAVFADSTKASVRTAIDRGVRADLVLKAQQFSGFSPAVRDRIAVLPGIDDATGLRVRRIRVVPTGAQQGDSETLVGADTAGLADTIDLRLAEGDLAGLDDGGILVHEDAARRYGVAVGDDLTVQFPLSFERVPVVGIYRQQDFAGGFPVSFVVSTPTFARYVGGDQQDVLVYATVDGSVADAQREVNAVLRRDYPNVSVLTRTQYRSEQEQAIDRFLGVVIALLLLSLLIAVVGIVNTLALSVFERTRELGMLRAVGMTRSQVRTMVRGESVVIAVLGGFVGLAVGLAWGWAFTFSLESEGITELRVPVGQLIAVLVACGIAGVFAAVLPARRAARLDVLDAIATE
jgi:putative ABC transport system permease protein